MSDRVEDVNAYRESMGIRHTILFMGLGKHPVATHACAVDAMVQMVCRNLECNTLNLGEVHLLVFNGFEFVNGHAGTKTVQILDAIMKRLPHCHFLICNFVQRAEALRMALKPTAFARCVIYTGLCGRVVDHAKRKLMTIEQESRPFKEGEVTTKRDKRLARFASNWQDAPIWTCDQEGGMSQALTEVVHMYATIDTCSGTGDCAHSIFIIGSDWACSVVEQVQDLNAAAARVIVLSPSHHHCR